MRSYQNYISFGKWKNLEDVDMAKFDIGCNYWGSKWGTLMWRNWDKESVENDIATLSQHNIRFLRVFPNWEDFQPLKKMLGCGGSFREYSLNGKKVEDEFGLDKACMENFEEFLKLCEKYEVTLIVSVLTGWMSGSMYCPPALVGKNLPTDPEALVLQTKFVRGFVRAFKDSKVIKYWGLGNECNNLGHIKDRNEAYLWTSIIRNAILAEDNTRKIMSDMHGLTPLSNGVNYWKIQDQGENCDVMCVHPYPSPTVGGIFEPMNGLRTSIIPTAQMNYYGDIANRPCLIQEQGTFNDMLGNREMAADFLRVNLFSSWANNALGYVWWCAHEQSELRFPPYNWFMNERELGLFNSDLSPKPVALQMQKCVNDIEKIPLEKLPERQVDAVCITTNCAENLWWGASATSYILAKESGLDVQFCYCEQKLPDANLYIVPCITGWACMPQETYESLLEKVKNGATVYFSILDGGLITDAQSTFGLISKGYERNTKAVELNIDGENLICKSNFRYRMREMGAEVISRDSEGNVIFSRNHYGKGWVYYLGVPLEKMLWESEGVFTDTNKYPYYKIYELFAKECLEKKAAISKTPEVALTIHKESEDSLIIVAINYADEAKALNCIIQKDWELAEILYGTLDVIQCCDMSVFRLKKVFNN